MLEENKDIYRTAANRISGWEKMNKNTLCNLYLDETRPNYKEAYLSAIICSYWGHIGKFYNISKSIATAEDVYEWLVDSIVYALEHASWRNPEKKIYNDPNGPDKVINRCMKSRRDTFYQAHNRQKRKGGFGTLSLDAIQEAYNENTYAIEDKQSSSMESDYAVNTMIKNCFTKQKYLTAFIIDNIAYGNTFKLVKEIEAEAEEEKKENKKLDKEALRMAKLEEQNPDGFNSEDFIETEVKKPDEYYMFNQKMLVKRIKQLSIDDADYFAKRYQLPVEVVKDKLINYCIGAKDADIKRYIQYALEDLKVNFNRGMFDADRFFESR